MCCSFQYKAAARRYLRNLKLSKLVLLQLYKYFNLQKQIQCFNTYLHYQWKIRLYKKKITFLCKARQPMQKKKNKSIATRKYPQQHNSANCELSCMEHAVNTDTSYWSYEVIREFVKTCRSNLLIFSNTQIKRPTSQQLLYILQTCFGVKCGR